MRLNHIALYCLDLEGMREFFIRHFDVRSNELYHNPKTGLRTYFLTFTEGSTQLEIMSRPDVDGKPTDVNHLGYVHMAISLGKREKVDRLTEALRAEGYATLNGPRVTGDGFYESVVSGPEGILLELTE